MERTLCTIEAGTLKRGVSCAVVAYNQSVRKVVRNVGPSATIFHDYDMVKGRRHCSRRRGRCAGASTLRRNSSKSARADSTSAFKGGSRKRIALCWEACSCHRWRSRHRSGHCHSSITRRSQGIRRGCAWLRRGARFGEGGKGRRGRNMDLDKVALAIRRIGKLHARA